MNQTPLRGHCRPVDLPNVAFRTPHATRVLVVSNITVADKKFWIVYKDKFAQMIPTAGAVATYT